MFLYKNYTFLKKTYIIFFTILLFLIFQQPTYSSSTFKVSDIEITEPFNNNFKKKIVIDKAFILAFKKLINMTVSSNEMIKIKNFNAFEIKNLVDSFDIKNEKFINDTYKAVIDVNFNKQNTFLYFEKKNIFPSIPYNKNIIILPILINVQTSNVNLFTQNPFYRNWNIFKKDHHLINYILPPEDLDIVKILNDKINELEDYNFVNIIKKYDTKEYIICLIFKDKSNYKIFSKIKINEDLIINSKTFNNKDINDPKKLENLITVLREIYEDKWKEINKINRSVKLPLNISISSQNLKKNKDFNKFLSSTEQISNYYIKDFNNEKLNYKILFNGSPNQFLSIAEQKNILISTENQIWEVK